jgi:hypothetical protein
VTIIAGDVFSAFKAAGVDDEVAKRAAAATADVKRWRRCLNARPDPESDTFSSFRQQRGTTRLGARTNGRKAPRGDDDMIANGGIQRQERGCCGSSGWSDRV